MIFKETHHFNLYDEIAGALSMAHPRSITLRILSTSGKTLNFTGI